MIFNKPVFTPLLTSVALACSGCAAHSSLVAKATATATFYTATYEHRCEKTGNPPPQCGPCQSIINRAAWEIPLAVTNRDIGYLPPEQVAELERLVSELEACP